MIRKTPIIDVEGNRSQDELVVHHLLKDIPVKYYKIPDDVEFNTDIFLCS